LQIELLEDRSLPSNYTFTDLGTLGGPSSIANDINTSGQVVGSADHAPSLEHAFIWTNGVMTDLGTLGGQGGWDRSAAASINDRGQVVGGAITASNVWHAFLVTPEDTDADGTPDRWYRDTDADGINDLMRDLGTLGGMQSSGATDINEAGQVVGGCLNTAGAERAFSWENGTMIDLGTLGGLQTGASAINDAGQVVGSSMVQNTGINHAFLWQNGVMIDLGSDWYTSSSATDINAAGQVIGNWGGYLSQGFLWTPTTPNETVGTFADLSPLTDSFPGPDLYSVASGINDAGQVVGTSVFWEGSEGGDYTFYRGVVWPDGTPRNLNVETFGSDLIQKLPGADANNNAGQIVGKTVDGHAYLLTPIGTDLPRLTVEDVTVLEGNSGTQTANFTVTLSAASDQTVTVAYSTTDGTATAGSDYEGVSGTVSFAPGETSKTITVAILGDTTLEPNETFFVNLSAPTNAAIGNSQGIGTIVNDDLAPRTLSIGGVTVTEGNSGTRTATFTVTLSAASTEPVTVAYATADSTATAGSDYQAASSTLIFAPGETSKPVTVLINGDRIAEPTETFAVNLSAPTNATIADGTGAGTILDDEPRISISDVAKAEGRKNHKTLFTFTATLSTGYDQAVTVSYRTTEATATTGDGDYVGKTGTLTFAPGETTKTITIEVKGDNKREADEYFYRALFGNSSNSLFTNSRGIGTILNDD